MSVARTKKTSRSPAFEKNRPTSVIDRPPAGADANNWREGVLLPAMASAIALWAAFPPLGWSVLGWVAPIGWLMVAERPRPVGRRGYFIIWLSGCVFWLLILQGVRLAFWALYFGWIALSLYLAVYIPLFVGLTRLLRHRYRLPLPLAAPIAWAGMEWIRSYMLTGYAANSLAHTQAHRPLVIQIADQFGGVGLGFIMLAVAACAVAWWYRDRVAQPRGVAHLAWGSGLMLALLAYGGWRLAQADAMQRASSPLLHALLVQENTPSVFEIGPRGDREARNREAWTDYLNLTRESAQQFMEQGVDVVIWPESTFTASEPWLEAELSGGPPPELGREGVDTRRLLDAVEDMQQRFRFKTQLVLSAAAGEEMATEQQVGDSGESGRRPHLLVGSDAIIYTSDDIRQYNAAFLIDPDGQIAGRYDKIHLVMFGEYIPLGPLLQPLRDAFGLGGLDAGLEAKCFEVDGVCVAPSICFESMMPQVINWQVRSLTAAGRPPQILVNVTNDSWFQGSSILDHHLASSMLCAVENRRPMLIAANTGISAAIDGSGRLQQASARFESVGLLAAPHADGRWGLVQWAGFPLGWICAALSGMAMFGASRSRD